MAPKGLTNIYAIAAIAVIGGGLFGFDIVSLLFPLFKLSLD